MIRGYIHLSIETGRLRSSWVVRLLVLFFASTAYSQSLGDLARQERERQLSEPKHATHVYTNEDLAKPRILVPEDQARVQSGEKPKPAASQPAAESAGDETPVDKLPLGDIARHDRALKEAARKAEPPPAIPPSVLSTPPLAYPKFDHPMGSIAPPPVPVPIVTTNVERGKVAPGEEIASGTRVRVQSGDTLWGLAQKYLGRGEDWMLLAVANPQFSDPTHIPVGAWVRLPDKSQPATPPARIRIQRGDTLSKLTQEYFGDGEAWQCLAQANPQIKNTNVVLVGQTLTLPKDCAATSPPRAPNLSVSSKSLPSVAAATP